MKTKLLSFFIAAVMLFAMAAPVAAADSSATKTVDIRVKAGSTQMKVDGKAVQIAAPYAASGTTMLPTAVFTKGLDAKLTVKNKSVTLSVPKHSVTVTIGSKSAAADGKKLSLPAAPAVKKEITYLPVKVAQSLGAKVTVDSSTKEIRITATVAAAAAPKGSSIDSDSGKSKIGDSYYEWSMNYPTGLAQDFQSEDGDQIVFRDVKKNYYLAVNVEEIPDPMSSEELRELLMMMYVDEDETIIDKQTVTANGVSYEKIATKGYGGFYYEFRAYQANKKVYVVIYGKKATSLADLRKSTGILDSFKSSFDRSDRSIKDLTKITSDLKTFKNADYGLTLTLPRQWKSNSVNQTPYYSTNDGAYLSVDVTSLVPGDTVEAWAKRKQDLFVNIYLESYRKTVEMSDVTWNGVPAKMLKLSYSMDGTEWWEEYEVFAVQGSYRYYTELAYPVETKNKYGTLMNTLLQSMKINFKTVEQNFGNIPDESDMVDWTKTVTKTDQEYGYSVTVPAAWRSGPNMGGGFSAYSLPGGSFAVMVFEDMPDPQTFIADMRDKNVKQAAENSKFKLIENTTVTFAGKTAVKLVAEDTRNSFKYPYTETVYLFEHKGNVYLIDGLYYHANGTETVKKQLEDALNSFKLN
ncbi:copper amine oxidase N-terminal domain-containing protein [Cohnella pontilimi]|uniref:Copper amine oxidase N-terminal domain-containing protein n=1 Tax=Cohnella pontilimi TaxID=2564100 RepID=A0A4U0FCP2_9BACL|nr:stalk domain-containing protein [Cohnella pontilimi]TJY42004.1 copper amine oxidase N-terminal domain-containing protein [Cohnella pontilimi]